MDTLRCQQTKRAKIDSALISIHKPKARARVLSPLFFLPPSTLRRRGFILITLLPLITALTAGFSGLSLMSLGIKNLTRSQSLCIRESLYGQRKQGVLLTRLLNLNRPVIQLSRAKQVLQKALMSAVGLGQIQMAALLKKQIFFLQKRQELFSLQQTHLLMESERNKKTAFKKLKNALRSSEIKNIQEESFFKTALAVSKKNLDPKANVYQPVPDFSKKQTVAYLWEIYPFFQLNKDFMDFFQWKSAPYIKSRCSATLKKQGGKWTARLTYQSP